MAGLSKTYGSTPALNDLDLEIGRGEFVAIVGPSGSGKTTLLGLMGLLETPSTGDYELGGAPVARIGDREASALRNRHFGFVFQQFHLLPQATAWENVARPLVYAGISAAERKSRSLAMLKEVGLSHRSDHRATQLSGGEQQRVAIARALVNDPAVVLADEPTGNLPQEQWEQVLGLLESEWRRGKTVIVVTHDPAVAARAQRIVRLRDGRLDQKIAS
ncbi:MAG: ABC transporter ATP-binding protein [Trueperaceae bacterium]|nr:ABC transporter ATP-binding protein [Trueperaceae bacterium]